MEGVGYHRPEKRALIDCDKQIGITVPAEGAKVVSNATRKTLMEIRHASIQPNVTHIVPAKRVVVAGVA